MQELNLKANKREIAGKKYSKQLHKKGMIPANIYGGKEDNLMIEITAKDLHPLLYTDKVYFVNIDVDGEVTKCIKKEEQFHPVTDEILHVDFLRIYDDKKVKLYVPIHLTGFSKGVKAGGHLFQMKRYLRIEAFPKDVPDFLEIDVTDLNLGKSLKIEELKFENITILEPSSDVVALVKLTRAAMSEADSGTPEEKEAPEGEEE